MKPSITYRRHEPWRYQQPISGYDALVAAYVVSQDGPDIQSITLHGKEYDPDSETLREIERQIFAELERMETESFEPVTRW